MNIDIRFYWKLLLRRFPVMALLLTLCTGLAAFTALRMPESFSTSARLLVEAPQIPGSTLEMDATEQLDIVQQRLLTRANLIDIANRFDVYDDLRSTEPDTIIDRMLEDTTIRRSAGRDSATLMTISFRGSSGQIAADVVNQYVTLVLEENIGSRVSRAENTLDFFEQEVARLSSDLDESNIRISTFKRENADALPENQDYRLGRQALLQERLARLERDTATIRSQRSDIENIFQATGQIGNAPDQAMTPEAQQLLIAETDLQQALLTYSAENPRVVRLQSVVDRLKAIVASQATAGLVSDDGLEAPATPAEVMFQATLIEMDGRIESLVTEIDTAEAELEVIEQSISASSINGIQLNALERDFQVLQAQYDTAVANLNQAQMNERLESTAQGQRISVIENANVPRLPSGPDRPKVVALGAGIGFVLAGGLFVLLELLNRTVRRPEELYSKFNVVPLATLPYLESTKSRFIRRTLLIVGSLIAVVGVPAALWYFDKNYMPLDLLVQKVIAQLGF